MREETRKKKLLLVIPSIAIGGMEQVALATSEALKDRYDILLVYFYKDSTQLPFSVQTVCLGVPYGTNGYTQVKALFARNYKLFAVKKRFQPDISFAFGVVASISNLMTKQKEFCAASIHGSSSIPKTNSTKLLTKWCFSKADDIICVSKQLMVEFAKSLCLPENRFRVVYNPLDTDRIRSMIPQTTEKTAEGKTIILVGRLDANKNVAFAIDAVSSIVQRHPDVKLKIIGDGAERKALQAYAIQLNLGERVVFTGFLANPYIEIMLADALLSVSFSEGFPIVLIEALCCGTPIIACDCQTGPREILAPDTPEYQVAAEVEYAKYGVLLPPSFNTDTSEERQNKLEFLISALERVLFDTDLALAYQREGFLRANDLSIDQYKEKLISGWEK